MIVSDILCCPTCHGELGPDACERCGRQFVRGPDQVRFVSVPIDTRDAAFQAETQNRSSFTGRAFELGKSIVSSEYQPRNHLRVFLENASGVVVELGSGSRRLRQDLVNIDLFPSANVDVVADISETPIKSGTVDCVILDSVIEHVPDPIAVVREASRILKPGGKLFINCPFMLPYHGYPKHYQNYTRDGLEHLLRDFSEVAVRPNFGPMTAWVNMTAEIFGVMVGGERGLGYVVAKGLILIPIFWLKFLDGILIRPDRAHRVAGMLNALAVK